MRADRFERGRIPWDLRAPIGIASKVTLLLCAIVLASTCAVGVTMYWQFSQTLVAQELRELSALARNMSARFAAQIEALRADALFLAHSPVVRGMIRARQSAGIDPLLLETERELRQRMEAVFVDLLDVKSFYCQVRLIGIEDGGREIVRVDRETPDGPIQICPGGELQKKAAPVAVRRLGGFVSRLPRRGFTGRLLPFGNLLPA